MSTQNHVIHIYSQYNRPPKSAIKQTVKDFNEMFQWKVKEQNNYSCSGLLQENLTGFVQVLLKYLKFPLVNVRIMFSSVDHFMKGFSL